MKTTVSTTLIVFLMVALALALVFKVSLFTVITGGIIVLLVFILSLLWNPPSKRRDSSLIGPGKLFGSLSGSELELPKPKKRRFRGRKQREKADTSSIQDHIRRPDRRV